MLQSSAMLIAVVTLLLASWGGNAQNSSLPRLVPSTVRIPNHLDAAIPFNTDRQLLIPEGFAVEVYARAPGARFLMVLPNGDLLVSQPGSDDVPDGKVSLVSKDATTGLNVVSDFVTGGFMPHGLALHRIGETYYIYVAEAEKVLRYPYKIGDKVAGRPELLITVPRGAHVYRNIAIGNDTLFLSIGSNSNDDPQDLARDPKFASIYAYSLDGKNRRLVTSGVRNAEGLAFAPGTADLWVVVNQRDDVWYPYKDETGNYGKVIPEYVDDHPPEEFTKIIEGKNYGWPYCNPEPSTSMNDLPYVADAKRNADSEVKDCSQFARVVKGMEPHSAPLGLAFWTGTEAPEVFRNGAVVGMHGSWNRRAFSGHKVAFFSWENGRPGSAYDLVSGWVTDAVKKQRWGRPVDVAVLLDGSLAISDDASGTVYRLYRQ